VNDVLVIIPTYNEAGNLDALIRELDQLASCFDCLMVDDNSPDGTAARIREFQKTRPWLHLLERQGKEGLGKAYLAGFAWALQRDYQYIAEMDADLSHNPHDVPKLVQKCRSGFELVIGSRYVGGIRIINWPLQRLIISYCGSIYSRFWTGLPVTDPTSGFKCFHRSVLEAIDLSRVRSNGYVFQVEMDLYAWKLGFKLGEAPIVFTERQLGKSKMSARIVQEAIWRIPLLGIKTKLGRIPRRASWSKK
jgi:dolichol-phosphate mannosyltransferase